jgi:hypothetical protein
VAEALEQIDARPDPEAPFGAWETQPDGERRWVQHEPTPEELAARAAWRPNSEDPASFDHLLQSAYGAIDIVPEVGGTYAELRPRAVRLSASGHDAWVESMADLLATLTVPRRAKDRDRVLALRALQRGDQLR